MNFISIQEAPFSLLYPSPLQFFGFLRVCLEGEERRKRRRRKTRRMEGGKRRREGKEEIDKRRRNEKNLLIVFFLQDWKRMRDVMGVHLGLQPGGYFALFYYYYFILIIIYYENIISFSSIFKIIYYF